MTANPQRPVRRGVALLIVLAWLVVVLTIVGGVAASAATRRLGRTLDADSQTLEALRHATSDVVLSFLEVESAGIVLPADMETASVTVLHDRLHLQEGLAAEMRITAWDQCGMVPWNRVRSGSPVRGLIPGSILAVLDAAAPNGAEEFPVGLDSFVPIAARSDAVRVFPEPDGSAMPRDFGEAAAGHAESILDRAESRASQQALGEVVATHNDRPWRLNVNTAPATVLRAAMRDLGRGGAEAILESRESGLAARLGSSFASGSLPRGENPLDVTLATSSDAWAFRIDIAVNSVRSAWWEVYRLEASTGGGRREWRCVQRLRIIEP